MGENFWAHCSEMWILYKQVSKFETKYFIRYTIFITQYTIYTIYAIRNIVYDTLHDPVQQIQKLPSFFQGIEYEKSNIWLGQLFCYCCCCCRWPSHSCCRSCCSRCRCRRCLCCRRIDVSALKARLPNNNSNIHCKRSRSRGTGSNNNATDNWRWRRRWTWHQNVKCEATACGNRKAHYVITLRYYKRRKALLAYAMYVCMCVCIHAYNVCQAPGSSTMAQTLQLHKMKPKLCDGKAKLKQRKK